MDRKKIKDKLEKMNQKTDDWKNNQFTGYPFQALAQMPKEFKNFGRDKQKEVDPGKAFLGRNKRRRRRDVIEHPENVVGPRN
jgi:hypothetical protein